ncbi:MAG: hypothetical protein Q9191_000036 [Dirinaria sp. TL-2023a]
MEQINDNGGCASDDTLMDVSLEEVSDQAIQISDFGIDLSDSEYSSFSTYIDEARSKYIERAFVSSTNRFLNHQWAESMHETVDRSSDPSSAHTPTKIPPIVVSPPEDSELSISPEEGKIERIKKDHAFLAPEDDRDSRRIDRIDDQQVVKLNREKDSWRQGFLASLPLIGSLLDRSSSEFSTSDTNNMRASKDLLDNLEEVDLAESRDLECQGGTPIALPMNPLNMHPVADRGSMPCSNEAMVEDDSDDDGMAFYMDDPPPRPASPYPALSQNGQSHRDNERDELIEQAQDRGLGIFDWDSDEEDDLEDCDMTDASYGADLGSEPDPLAELWAIAHLPQSAIDWNPRYADQEVPNALFAQKILIERALYPERRRSTLPRRKDIVIQRATKARKPFHSNLEDDEEDMDVSVNF